MYQILLGHPNISQDTQDLTKYLCKEVKTDKRSKLETMEFVPTQGESKFAMWANKIKKAGLTVDVVEVWNTSPVNPRRKEDNEARTKKPLRFGSRVSVTTAGNWE